MNDVARQPCSMYVKMFDEYIERKWISKYLILIELSHFLLE